MRQKTAIIIGAGPAGLTAAYELLARTDIKPRVYEMTGDLGGLAKTVDYKGNRIDCGGHRFFSKSDRVLQWWQKMLPLQGAPAKDDILLGKEVPVSREKDAPDPEKTDRVMLIRSRLSRIFFLRKFFDYPLSLNLGTIGNLGLRRLARIGLSYLKVRLFPIREEKSLEDFFINRFGRELYLTFFKSYTEKVWGIPCSRIKPEWGAQRVKGLSILGAVLHALKSVLAKDTSVAQRRTETSLIDRFLYPKFGPGQMWEEAARTVEERGGEIYLRHKLVGLRWEEGRVVAGTLRNEDTGELATVSGDFFFSTMPVKELIQALGDGVPEEVRQAADGLVYRDFLTVGLLLKKLKIRPRAGEKTIGGLIPDNWIYVQESDVKLGRLQIFNNWSPYLVEDEKTAWLGLEYFCDEGDELWRKPDDELVEFAADELARIGMIDRQDVLDGTVLRAPKAYPAYLGTYERFHVIREFTDALENLFLIGRNGMHRYNNQDHSMLAAMVAVDSIVEKRATKDEVWTVNTEPEYHEETR